MTRASTLADNASVMSQPVGTAPGYMARAWVNFNGTGTVAIRASGNVTSITDNGTGDYTVNFTTAMSDANYSTAGSVSYSGSVITWNINLTAAPTTTAIRVATVTGGGVLGDASFVNICVFR